VREKILDPSCVPNAKNPILLAMQFGIADIVETMMVITRSPIVKIGAISVNKMSTLHLMEINNLNVKHEQTTNPNIKSPNQ